MSPTPTCPTCGTVTWLAQEGEEVAAQTTQRLAEAIDRARGAEQQASYWENQAKDTQRLLTQALMEKKE